MDQVPYKVLIPDHILEVHQNNPELFKRIVLRYMKRYPHYEVKGVDNGFAICRRKGEGF